MEYYHNMWWILDSEKGEFCATELWSVIYINRSKIQLWFGSRINQVRQHPKILIISQS